MQIVASGELMGESWRDLCGKAGSSFVAANMHVIELQFKLQSKKFLLGFLRILNCANEDY